jgi:hypothetical protein
MMTATLKLTNSNRVTSITERQSVNSPIGGWGSCTAASKPIPLTTRQSRGHTIGRTLQFDINDQGVSPSGVYMRGVLDIGSAVLRF